MPYLLLGIAGGFIGGWSLADGTSNIKTIALAAGGAYLLYKFSK